MSTTTRTAPIGISTAEYVKRSLAVTIPVTHTFHTAGRHWLPQAAFGGPERFFKEAPIYGVHHISFDLPGQKGLHQGISMAAILTARTRGLDYLQRLVEGGATPALQPGAGMTTMHLAINWPGYESARYDTESLQARTITHAELAWVICQNFRAFLPTHPGLVPFEKLVLVGLHHITCGRWQADVAIEGCRF